MSDDSPSLRRFTISSSGGVALQAEMQSPPQPRLTVVVAHPSPQFGGDMHSNVVSAVFRSAPGMGVAVVRFNFRGVGESTGHHDGGPGERDDLRAVLAHCAAESPSAPLAIAGYSFGAETALTVDHPRSVGWFLVSPVFRMFPLDQMVASTEPRPKRILIAEHDQYAPPVAARESTRGWKATTIEVAPMSDHFFGAGTQSVVDAFGRFVDEVMAAP
ncbi:MAG: alpha/beta fold hydrolase [Acidimicrobiales bacterium]